MRSIFGRRFRTLVTGCGISAILLAAPLRSEATTLHMSDGGSSADVCVPGICSTPGLQNFVIDGVDQNIEQWFWFTMAPDGNMAPNPVSGPIDMISA